jgi:hypothetical protein
MFSYLDDSNISKYHLAVFVLNRLSALSFSIPKNDCYRGVIVEQLWWQTQYEHITKGKLPSIGRFKDMCSVLEEINSVAIRPLVITSEVVGLAYLYGTPQYEALQNPSYQTFLQISAMTVYKYNNVVPKDRDFCYRSPSSHYYLQDGYTLRLTKNMQMIAILV